MSGKEDIERLRREANGKYHSTSYPGAYMINLAENKENEFIAPKRRVEVN